MKVFMTGAGGRMATVLRPAPRVRYGGLTLLSRDEIHDLDPSERLHVADLGDLDATVEAAHGIDAILHLGGIADEAPFDAVPRALHAGPSRTGTSRWCTRAAAAARDLDSVTRAAWAVRS